MGCREQSKRREGDEEQVEQLYTGKEHRMTYLETARRPVGRDGDPSFFAQIFIGIDQPSHRFEMVLGILYFACCSEVSRLDVLAVQA